MLTGRRFGEFTILEIESLAPSKYMDMKGARFFVFYF